MNPDTEWAERVRSGHWTDMNALDPADERRADFGELRLGRGPGGLRVAVFADDLLSIECLMRRVR